MTMRTTDKGHHAPSMIAERPPGPHADLSHATVICLTGDIDRTSVPEIHVRIEAVLAVRATVLLDLSGVMFFGADACRLLVGLHAQAAAIGATLQVIRPTDLAHRVLLVTGLDQLLSPAEGWTYESARVDEPRAGTGPGSGRCMSQAGVGLRSGRAGVR